jgi:hypothetical protein
MPQDDDLSRMALHDRFGPLPLGPSKLVLPSTSRSSALCGSMLPLDDSYHLRETAYAGRGAFAARPLLAGRLFIHEVPLRSSSVAGLARLARETHLLEGLCGGDTPEDIVSANHFVDPDGCVSLFRRISMLNHTCCPNASMAIGYADGSACVILARDVAEGEEITLCYSADVIFAPYEARQERLHRGWGFDCRCARCSGHLTIDDATKWQQLEEAAAALARPNVPPVDPWVGEQQREQQRAAILLLDGWLPHLLEREAFTPDAQHFS